MYWTDTCKKCGQLHYRSTAAPYSVYSNIHKLTVNFQFQFLNKKHSQILQKAEISLSVMTICCTLVFFFIRTSAWQRLINKAETYGTLNNRISLSTSEVFTLYRIYTAVRTAAISHNWYDLKIITRQNIVQI